MTVRTGAASAQELRGYLAGKRGYRLVKASLSDILYRAYVVFGVGGFYVAMGISGILDPGAAPVGTGLDAALTRGLLVGGSALLLLAMLRVSTWAGPVMVGRQDAAWLLPAPVDRRELLRPHLVGGCVVGAAAGAAAGGATMALLASVRPVAPLAALFSGVTGGLLLGLLAAAAGWFVEARPALACRVHRLRVVGWVAVLGLGWLAVEVPASVWLGPWGWAATGLIDAAATPVKGWPLGLLGAAAVAVLVAVRAERALPAAPDEELTRRAGLHATVASSITYFDARTIADAYHTGVLRFRRIPRFRVPPPRQPWLLPLWIDVVTLLRRREAVGRSLLATVGAVALVAAWPRELAAVALASVLAYFAGAPLVEQLRRTVAQPGRLQPLSLDRRSLLLLHLAVPVAVLAVEVLLGIGVVGAAGLIPAAAVPDAVRGALPLVPSAVLIAAVTATRGYVPLYLMASGGMGSAFLVVWFALGPILALALVGLPAGAVAGSPELLGDLGAVEATLWLTLAEVPLLIAVLLWRAERRMRAG